VELIDLSGEGKLCPILPDYPLEVAFLDATFYEESVIVCGGSLPNHHATGRCFSLGPDLSSWKEIDTLPYSPRYSQASSIIDNKWFISGGYPESRSTLIYDGSTFTLGKELPYSRTDHCQLTINSTHVFFAGTEKETFLYNWEM